MFNVVFFRSIQKRRNNTLCNVCGSRRRRRLRLRWRHRGIYGQVYLIYMSIDRKYCLVYDERTAMQCRTSIFIGNDVNMRLRARCRIEFLCYFARSASFIQIIHYVLFLDNATCVCACVSLFFRFSSFTRTGHIWHDRLKSTHIDGCGLCCVLRADYWHGCQYHQIDGGALRRSPKLISFGQSLPLPN